MVGCRNVLVGLMLAWLLSGCHALNSCDEGWWYSSASKNMLNKAVVNFEEGNYIASMAAFNEVLQAKNADADDKVISYKYMAFIHCVSGREKQCYDSFKNALTLKQSFELTTAEAGHPVWGPVFRSAKGKRSK